MGHNTATATYAARRIAAIRDALAAPANADNPAARLYARILGHALTVGHTRGSLKEWMRYHHGASINTFQVNVHLDGAEVSALRHAWMPGSRKLDAETRKTGAILDGSIRDYAGVTTFYVDNTTYIGFSRLGSDAVQLVLHTT